MSEPIIKMTGGVIRQQKNTILKNVNIEIQDGEFVYLIGKVGSGKSSFLKTLYAELPLEYGNAEVAGFQLKKIKKSQIPLLRRKCGIVFQDFKLLIDRNVYANLEFVLKATGWKNKKDIRERIETVLEKVGMTDKKHKMPHQLSGGEQQRIVLARALLNAPPLILADEPTGNIDPETSYRLVELLKEICETGKTIIIATHQYDLIEKYPGRILCCDNGSLFEKSSLTAEELEEKPNTLENPEQTAENTSDTPLSVPAEVQITEITEPENKSEENTKQGTEEQEKISGQAMTTEQTEQPEEQTKDLSALIGELSFPEITAFDYEIAESTVNEPYSVENALQEENPASETNNTISPENTPELTVSPESEADKAIEPNGAQTEATEKPDLTENSIPQTEETENSTEAEEPKETEASKPKPAPPVFDLELSDL